MKAVKENAVYRVNDDTMEDYRRRGFDIYDDNDKLVAYGVGKKVSIEKYVALKEELEAVKAELETVKAELKALEKKAKKESKKEA